MFCDENGFLSAHPENDVFQSPHMAGDAVYCKVNIIDFDIKLQTVLWTSVGRQVGGQAGGRAGGL